MSLHRNVADKGKGTVLQPEKGRTYVSIPRALVTDSNFWLEDKARLTISFRSARGKVRITPFRPSPATPAHNGRLEVLKRGRTRIYVFAAVARAWPFQRSQKLFILLKGDPKSLTLERLESHHPAEIAASMRMPIRP